MWNCEKKPPPGGFFLIQIKDVQKIFGGAVPVEVSRQTSMVAWLLFSFLSVYRQKYRQS